MTVDPTDQAIQARPDPPPPPVRRPGGGWVASTDRVVQTRPDPSPWRAAALIALAWLPAIVAAASLPRFVPTFDRWPWEVPPLTHALMSIGRLGYGPIVLAGEGLVVVLASVAAVWAWAGFRGPRVVAFTIAVIGLGVLVVCMAGTLGAIFMAPIAWGLPS
jgi:hypothetical protein